jgi:beta-phosphoglucomutase-like phosphatase (HAD superfamily)
MEVMIQAIIFDLDGVLVQTEKLKALAYAKAVRRVRGFTEPDFRAAFSII